MRIVCTGALILSLGGLSLGVPGLGVPGLGISLAATAFAQEMAPDPGADGATADGATADGATLAPPAASAVIALTPSSHPSVATLHEGPARPSAAVDRPVEPDETAATEMLLPAEPEVMPADSAPTPHTDGLTTGSLAAPADMPVAAFPEITVPDVVVSIPAETKSPIATYLEGHPVPGPARLGKAEREAIGTYYAERAFMPLWLNGDQWTAGARALIATLEKAGEDGLDAADYPIPIISVLPKADRAEALAEADLKLSALAVTYARDARGGRLNPRRISALMTPTLDLPTADDVLRRLADSPDTGKALAGYNPPQPGYQALKAKLADIRAAHPTTPMVRVPQGPALKVGMRDPRVPLVRARFRLENNDATTYDERVAAAVATFQKENGLPADGILNRQTVAAMSPPSTQRLDETDILVNMERWRWLPAAFSNRYLIVNIPAYSMDLVNDGEVELTTRVIVGKPESPTPVFSHVMQHVIVNPYWNVPPSILRKEFLPAMAKDPDYAARRGYQVIRRGNSISVRQPPGERNALGYIKFMFPNDHAVYLHDTPNRSLFNTERRAYSHGCVRVEQPFRLAEFVLGKDWPEQRMRKLIGKGERLIKLQEPLPIHLVYFTLSVDKTGAATTRNDIYGFDRRMKEALGLAG
ncbi:L,D-transpeptidase family protein [Chelatococcus asaccharovorans]|uniref:L,D-transpeptidase family protein n=1 Tax=Chelatococcus asaccharovorans TaxID=28210 RepID=UPI00224C699A|nr:L,D-transpeptidase family protein [Chelatococcus asaccharovorans]CAH1648502.1 Murein L,D-transpeptidase YcbB/YkuD [Chelatococcus asaccharovorans]CAH1687692.1 Murein L,D-transpeptidase YcbB/YkuD [Chelatococcus asaccharovorans]